MTCAVAAITCRAAQISMPQAVSAPPVALVSETPVSGSSMPVVSADGRYMAFVSHAPNLVTNPTRGNYQVFLRNMTNGNIILVSATPARAGGNDHSTLPSLSSNGWRIAFESDASDLIPDDTNGVTDVFIHDVGHRQTWAVTGGNGPSRNPMMSQNGYVAFESRASNLISGDNNGRQDVFLSWASPEETAIVSVNLAGTGSANGSSELLDITPNGRFVAFWSDATDIVPEAVSGSGDVYVRDMQAAVSYCLTEGLTIYDWRRFKVVLTPDGGYAALQELELIDPWPGPVPGAAGRVLRADVFAGSVSNVIGIGRPGRGLAISDDASRLIFYGVVGLKNGLYLRDMSVATNRLLVEVAIDVGSFKVSRDFQNLYFTMALTNRGFQLFRHSLVTSETVLLSGNAMGQPLNAGVSSPFGISESSELVAFETAADDVVPGDFNRAPDVFVVGQGLVAPRRSELAEGTGYGLATLHREGISANGKRIIFSGADSSLVANDTNKNLDVFASELISNAVVAVDGVIRTNNAMATIMSADGSAVLTQRLLGDEFNGRFELYRTDLRTGQSQPIQPGFFRVAERPLMTQDGRWAVISDGARIRLTDFRTPVLPGQASNQVVDLRFDGSREGNGVSSNATISMDGRWVAFMSRAIDLVNPGENGGAGSPYPSGVPQVFARNLREKRTRLVSFTDNGAPFPAGAANPLLSANARYVVFQSLSGSNIYRHDLLATGQVINVLVCTNCSKPSLSGDGQKIAYQSAGQIFVANLNTAFTQALGGDKAGDPAISVDGRFVAYASRVSDISQIHVRDLWNNTTHVLSQNHLGTAPGNKPSTRPVMSHDGRTIAFQSFASDLVPGDYNGRRDIFVVQIAPIDTDGDGMDDGWETHYFQNLARDGSGNVDGDHLNDRDEFLAGTDPLDSTSALRFTGISSRIVAGAMQDTELKWASAPGKTYRVQHRPDLATPWSDLFGDIVTGGPHGVAARLDPAQPNGFYRLLLAP